MAMLHCQEQVHRSITCTEKHELVRKKIEASMLAKASKGRPVRGTQESAEQSQRK